MEHSILFSVIVPVYNRPIEIDELLCSLTFQTYKNFEVIIVEDGSTELCESIVAKYSSLLNIKYHFKVNEGRAVARNYGMSLAQGTYFIIFDSDCIIPPEYFSELERYIQTTNLVHCFGGPDAAHPDFTAIQKAINYTMTSFYTTGGIRGSKKKMTKFYPRSFNMGIHREVWNTLGGFPLVPLAEDIEYSFKIEQAGFRLGFIPKAFVYHKRRTNFRHFFKQVNRFGIGRIDLFKKYPNTLKLSHFIPALFTIYFVVCILTLPFYPVFAIPLIVYLSLVFLDAGWKYRSPNIAILSVIALMVQMLGYGTGFIKAFILRVLLGKDAFGSY